MTHNSHAAAEREYNPRGVYKTIHLPAEVDLRVSVTIGLRPFGHGRSLRGFAGRRGVGVRIRGFNASIGLDRSRRDARLGHESRLSVEQRLNAALGWRRTIRFDRSNDGQISGWGCVPVQIEGTVDDQRFYFRFRGNTARLDIYQPGSDGVDDSQIATTATVGDVYPVAKDPSNCYAGDFASYDDLVRVFLNLLFAQQPVDVVTNPTYGQDMSRIIMLMRLAESGGPGGRDLAAEQTLFEECQHRAPEIVDVVRDQWDQRCADHEAAAAAAAARAVIEERSS